MDQLKLALEHKFWILAGLAILLPPIGWWAATDNLATETAARNKKIADTEKRIPDPKDFPNEKWIQGEKQIERDLTTSVTDSQERLFEHQKSEMTLPPVVQGALNKCKVKYRGDGGALEDFLNAKEFFVQSYLEDWKNTVNLVKPFKARTGEGLVFLNDEPTEVGTPITRHLEVEQWRQSLGFTGPQMWDVQEDLWFLRSLMQAIARVNQGATEIGNSRIKRINEATLRGGDLTDLATRRAGTAGANPVGNQSGTGVQISFGHNRGGGATSGPTYTAPKPFDPDDIFGDDGGKANTGATPGKKDKDVVVVETKRWAETGAKWHKRGFVLRLVMDEREIPTLLTSLSESPFPVEILHVEHSVHSSNTADAFRSITDAGATTSPDGSETSTEQQALQQRILENLRMAFNMHYLADVIVAGTLTIYDEPATTASKNAPATQAGSNQATAGSMRPTGGKAETKTPLPVGNSTKSARTQSKPLSLSPGTKFPGTKAEPAKIGAPVSPPPSGNKTNSGSPKGAGASKPAGTPSGSGGK